MMSLEHIIAINDEIAAEAERKQLEPYTPNSLKEIEAMPPFPFPSLGEVPPGWEEVESFFVDGTGFGRPSEYALTANQLRAEVLALFSEHPDYAYAITEEGPFQVVVSALRRVRSEVTDRLSQ